MPHRLALERDLIQVRDNLLRLTSMADQAIACSIRALVERNSDLAHQVSADDRLLNDLRYTIEEACYRLLATQQPAATDLRLIVGTVSVATNLERIGDHAAGVARLALRMADRPLPGPLVGISEMAVIGREMVRSAVDAFLDHSVALAERTVLRDADIDQLQARVYRDLIALMAVQPAVIETATFLLWISHNLERIGDRATNICERAIYLATGELKEFRTHW